MSEFQASNFNKENGGVPNLVGKTELTSPYFFVPPSGDTASRPANCAAGTLRFNTDFGTLEVYRGDEIGWHQIQRAEGQYLGGLGAANSDNSIDGTGTRGIFAGGYTPSAQPNSAFNNTDVITVDTLGNSVDFNNLSSNRAGCAGFGDRTRALVAGGVGPLVSQYSTISNVIEFCTFSKQDDYTDFGDLTTAGGYGGSLADKTRGVIMGGTYPYQNTIQFVTMQTTGNSIDFGDLTEINGYPGGCASSTRGFAVGGLRVSAPDTASYNTIDVITISSTGNATAFGEMQYANYEHAIGSNSVRAIKAGGYGPNYSSRIEFFNMASGGDTIRFGDLTGFSGTGKGGVTSPTRFVIAAGYGTSPHFMNTMEFVQIATTGDSVDFGDLAGFGRRLGVNGASNGHGGL